jgi:hypothetical protein
MAAGNASTTAKYPLHTLPTPPDVPVWRPPHGEALDRELVDGHTGDAVTPSTVRETSPRAASAPRTPDRRRPRRGRAAQALSAPCPRPSRPARGLPPCPRALARRRRRQEEKYSHMPGEIVRARSMPYFPSVAGYPNSVATKSWFCSDISQNPAWSKESLPNISHGPTVLLRARSRPEKMPVYPTSADTYRWLALDRSV